MVRGKYILLLISSNIQETQTINARYVLRWYVVDIDKHQNPFRFLACTRTSYVLVLLACRTLCHCDVR
jgi:hypothetical protein